MENKVPSMIALMVEIVTTRRVEIVTILREKNILFLIVSIYKMKLRDLIKRFLRKTYLKKISNLGLLNYSSLSKFCSNFWWRLDLMELFFE